MPNPLPLPAVFDPRNAEVYDYAPDQQRLFADAAAWRRAHGITAAAADKQNVHLLLIDVQKDFCFPRGSLYVGGRSGRGALDDSRRIAEFVYRNMNVLTHVTTTMDTHFAFQIFFPSFWVDRDERPLAPFREITTDDIDRGDVRPNPAVAGWLCDGNYPWLLAQARHYCAELEKAGKYRLYLWPPHCILGSDGHALVGVIHEARMFHAFARGVQSWVESKGGNALTENYSVLRPEVLTRHDGQPIGEKNTAFIQKLLAADAVVVAGQAASHCVKSSIDDLLEEIVARDRALARKVYLLADCMSAVTVPDGKGGFVADFTPQADEALRRFADAGMHVVRSTDPIATWPGMHMVTP
jgi:nicotinamidase-related amidase